jgi:hypothetical protein
MENTVDIRMRLLVVAASPVTPGSYNIYGYYGLTSSGSYLFALEVNPATPGTASEVYFRKSNEGGSSSENRYGLLLSSDQKKLYLYGANFGDYVIGAANSANGFPLWSFQYSGGADVVMLSN